MPRIARRRADSLNRPPHGHVESHWRRLRITTVLQLAALVLAIAAATLLTLAIENSGLWSSFKRSIEALDFDPGRADLIQAWSAGIAFAAIAAFLCGRPWISAIAASVFVGVTYIFPFGERMRHDIPQVFGLKETLQPAALEHNQAVAIGVAMVAAVIAAASADLLRRSVAGTGRSLWLIARSPAVRGQLLLALLATLAIGATTLTSLTLAAGVDPLLRYGPEHGVYLPPVITPQPLPVYSARPSDPPEPMPATGHVLNRTYYSDAMGEDRHFVIYLPPSYGLKRAANRFYPVLFLLHGDPGGPTDWVQFGAPNIFDAGIATGALPETILVFPDGNGHVTAATQWADRADGRDRVEDAVIELVGVIDREYRTVPDRAQRLIGGLSSGGFGAANIAARHPDVFSIEMSFSGYFVATGPVFGGSSRYIRENSPYYLVQDQPTARTVRYILVVGNRDPYYQRLNVAFAGQLDRYRVPHDLSVVAGGHSPDVWQQGLVLGMTRMAQSVGVTVLPPERHTRGPQP